MSRSSQPNFKVEMWDYRIKEASRNSSPVLNFKMLPFVFHALHELLEARFGADVGKEGIFLDRNKNQTRSGSAERRPQELAA